MINWTEIIISLSTILLGGGGLVVLITLKDKKYAAMLENVKATIESNARTNDEWKEIAEEWRQECQELKASNDKKDGKIDELHSLISENRNRIDLLNTKVVENQLLRCEVLSCAKRLPPLGSIKFTDNADE